jgi:hypothetical protein
MLDPTMGRLKIVLKLLLGMVGEGGERGGEKKIP